MTGSSLRFIYSHVKMRIIVDILRNVLVVNIKMRYNVLRIFVKLLVYDLSRRNCNSMCCRRSPPSHV